ncbi:type I-E CRISPR-associated protein Cas6/Cse3/CasE [Loigolactobacillus bifermentans]|uniref:CRISPR associated family protein n=1 Tax=Loigolactobacillus bifermentans DSM 20003 TaxID=1423726 RepID=A0A0R1GLV3_9LACO|nr:type I-E CRISPR-associated protein Cas6/Cse3/CasE [Loigolactobacillus bifermentans]KRK34968.1 CRISPR associated family protein [Loigolactobacillus bifermentans DSM 20003]QGG61335.1 type I-E CRISPR-associated protein Cas6/Cse3/CasE [Loigolactobacillus bifermentans]
MYLSRVEIDTKNRQKLKNFTHLGAYHNWVEQGFPDEINHGERRRHLWRLDQLTGKNYLLVLSENEPNKGQLEKYGVLGTATTKSYDQFLDTIKIGDIMRFRLTANPSYTAPRPGQKRGRIYPCVTIARQRQWLIKKAQAAGFKLVWQQPAIDEVDGFVFDVVSRDYPMLHRKTGHGVHLSRVVFEGLLQVQDLTAFKGTLIKGLGREKAFGMGLMTVIATV